MISNSEILNRFDVLYNNITSSQAPGLDGYEKSVFWNKAQLEVLKNHLTPGGNKYGTGFDQSSKRQVEFSKLTVSKDYILYPSRENPLHPKGWQPLELVYTTTESDEEHLTTVTKEPLSPYRDILSVINERIDVTSPEWFFVNLVETYCFGDFMGFDADHDGEIAIGDTSALADMKLTGQVPKDLDVDKLISYLLGNMDSEGHFVLSEPKTYQEIIDEQGLQVESKTVVPVSNIELDTLLSRPFKHPPRSQVWRIMSDSTPEFVVGPNEVPIAYHIRYVKTPKEINLEDDTDTPEIPEMLIDEVLQRAVELAKAAYVSDATQQQLLQTLGERSE